MFDFVFEKMDFSSEEFLTAIINPNGNSKILNSELKSNVVGTEANHFSKIIGLTIDYEKDGEKFKKKFIIKAYIPSAPLYDLGKLCGWNERELIMYSKILPEMSKLLKPEYVYPSTFKSIYDEVLIFDDLRADGYKIIDRIKQVDLPHCMIALKMLAKFHAASVKLNKMMDLEDVKSDIFLRDQGIENPVFKLFANGYELACKIVEVKLPECFEKFKELKDDVLISSKSILNGLEDGFHVLNHGDFHLSNIMFKYDEDGDVIDGKMFDFQISRWCSPVTDIIYFVVNGLEFEIIENHLNDILSYYTEVLNDELSKKHECEERYEFDDVKKDFEKCWKYGLLVLILFSPFLLADYDDPLDLDEVINEDGIQFDAVSKGFSSRKFNQVFINWVSYYHKNGYL